MEIIIFCVVMFVGVVYGYFTVAAAASQSGPTERSMAAPRRLRPGQRWDATRACR